MEDWEKLKDGQKQNLLLRYFNIERFALHDGPGIRTVLFLQGCSLHCPWCANPESVPFGNVLLFDSQNCSGCRRCIPVCANGAISFNALSGKVQTERNKCTSCLKCADACVMQARSGSVKAMGIQEMARELLRDAPYFKATSGGVTFSGGEPLMQINALLPLFKILKEAGISIAVETCGAAAKEAYILADEYVDEWLFDLKSMDAGWLEEWTGAKLENVLENLFILAKKRPERITLRLVVIPGLNDGTDRFEKTGRMARTHGIRRADLLPYHMLGVQKYAKLEKPYSCPAKKPMKTEEVMAYAPLLENYGLIVRAGG